MGNNGTVVRYIFVAALCLAAHNAILISADLAGFSLLSAASLSFCILVVVGYVALSRWAFRGPLRWAAFGRYFLVMAANFPLSVGVLWLANVMLQHRMAIAAPVATIGMTGINFGLARWAILRRARFETRSHCGSALQSD
jgi:putative flippase GtrA